MTVPATPAYGLRARLGLPVPPKPVTPPRPVEPVLPVWLQRSRDGIQRPLGVDGASR